MLELGVGSGQQARVWLDTFRDLCAERGRDYLRRVRYLMSDYSHDVLQAARRNVAEYDQQVSCLNLDAADPPERARFPALQGAVHPLVQPVRQPARRRDRAARRPRLRGAGARYLPTAAVEAIGDRYSLERAELPSTIQRFLRIGPEYFDDVTTGVKFWAEVWDALRLEQRYVQVDDPDGYRVAPGLGGVRLGDLLANYPGDVRLSLPTVALQSFVNTLPLLHPRGMFQVQDLFLTDLDQYRGAFRGPGKMDGSIVNWLNGPLFRLVGAHQATRCRSSRLRATVRSPIPRC